MKPRDFINPKTGKSKRFVKSSLPKEDTCRLYAETTVPLRQQFLAACEVVQHDRDTVLNLLMERFVSDVVDYVAEHPTNELAWDDAKKTLVNSK